MRTMPPPNAPTWFACASVLMGAVLTGCAASPSKNAAAPSPLGPAVTLVATPIAPVDTGAPAASREPPADETPAPPAPLAPLPTPPAPVAAAPATPAARVLLADELPFYPVHLRARDSERAEHHRAAHEGHDARESREGHEGHEGHEGKESRHRPYHPAPGIVVDVTDAQGAVAAADLQRVARNLGYWPFRECYEERLRTDQGLSGKVSLELLVNPGGSVDRATVTNSTLRDEIAGACVAREARHLAFPPAATPTTAKVEVSLATGDEVVPTPKPFPNAESLRQALRAPGDAVRQCYLTGLGVHPDIGGRLELRFRLRKDGDVSEVTEVGDHDGRVNDVEVTRCVLGVYRTVKLPPVPRSSRERSFVYAIHFESKPAEAVAVAP